MSLRKATILSVFFLTALCIFPTELKAKNVKKSFINDIHYTGINFKIDSKHTNIELIKGKFILNNTVHDEFSYQINSSKFLNKIKRLHRKSYKDLRKQAKKFNKNKNYSPQLENWYRIDVTKEMTPQDIIDIYNSLLDIDIISIVELETPPISAGFENCPALNCEPDLPPGGGDSSGDTPFLQSYQTYLGQSPLGIDALYAWTKAGGNGQGVKIIDMENGFNSNHEDLPSTFILRADTNDSDHGTAVMSILGAKNDNKGITGIAHGAQLGFHGWSPNIAQAIVNASNYLAAGDIIILEAQINRNINNGDTCSSQNQDECVPVEWRQSVFDAILSVTNQGIIVIEAAGNGNENLDNPIYQNRFNRNIRDSGAFLISATNPYSSISRSYFSNYGTRIDFNAWGNNVAAAGLYGNTLFNGGINQRYGDGFSGTSSASPIVAGAVAILQGYSKHTKGQTLPPQTIKNILTSTGVQEPSGVQVGIRPNLKTAIQLLDSSVDLIMTAPRLSSNWEGCYGANSIFWNSIPNATFYKIFLNGNYWKSTSSTYTFVNVTRSSSSAVQACNSTLCSELSNQVTLRYSPSSECY